MKKYTLKKKYDPCVVLRTNPMIWVSNNPVGAQQHLTDELAELMLANGHRADIFEVTPDHIMPTKAKKNSEPEVLSDTMLKIYQIYYDDKSFRDVHKTSTGYNNKGKETVFFENTAIIDIITNAPPADYIGILSHKFYQKMPPHLTYQAIYNEISKSRGAIDVYSCHPQPGQGNHSVIKLAANYHPGYLETFKYVCDKIGLKYHIGNNRCHVYSQHFIAKRSVYKHFVDTVLIPAVAAMSDPTDYVMQDLIWKDSGYQKNNASALKNMKEKFGIEYYPMHTFILERMFTIWMDTNNYTFKTLWK